MNELLSRSNFAKTAGVTRQAICRAEREGRVVADADGKIDPSLEPNRRFIEARASATRGARKSGQKTAAKRAARAERFDPPQPLLSDRLARVRVAVVQPEVDGDWYPEALTARARVADRTVYRQVFLELVGNTPLTGMSDQVARTLADLEDAADLAGTSALDAVLCGPAGIDPSQPSPGPGLVHIDQLPMGYYTARRAFADALPAIARQIACQPAAARTRWAVETIDQLLDALPGSEDEE